MKKLPFCTLLGGAAFAIAGTVVLLEFAYRREPLLLSIPLVWDIIMVAIGAGVVLRCDCARRAGLIWGVFCIFASLVVGGAAFEWVLPPQAASTNGHRFTFLVVSVIFGVVYGIWQLIAFYSPAVRAWTAQHEHHDTHDDFHAEHGKS